jgi:hypothetical protein
VRPLDHRRREVAFEYVHTFIVVGRFRQAATPDQIV